MRYTEEVPDDSPRFSPRVSAGMILLILLVSWGSLYVACVANKTALPIDAPKMAMEDALKPPVFASLMGADPTPVGGYVRELFGRTPCESRIPLPYIVQQGITPQVGREWRCLFVSTVCPVPPEPDWWMWVIVSYRPPGPELPLNMTARGLTDCWLQVNPDMLVSVPPGYEGPPGSMLTRTPDCGRVTLRWTPPPTMAGQRVWMQLMVQAPGFSPGGFLFSHGIEITVGS